jgi:putative transposase
VHRVVADVAKDQGWPVPSYATVYALHGIDPATRTLALDGLGGRVRIV